MSKFMVSLALALACPGAVAERAAPPDPGAEILAALGTEPVDCDDARSSRYDEHIVAHCGTTNLTTKSFKKTWRKAVRSGPLAERMRPDGAPWRSTGATEKTMYTVLVSVPVAVSVDLAEGIVAVFSPRTFPGCHQGGQGFVWAAEANVVPQVVQRDFPDFPEEARRRPTGGAVLGSFVVDTTGYVVDVCIVAVEPAHVGFGPAAAEAQRRTSYRPATLDGQPVAVGAMFLTAFEVGMAGAPVSALVHVYFKRARTGS